jgi:F-box domain
MLMEIPPEVLLLILSELDIISRKKCRRICRRVRCLIDDQLALIEPKIGIVRAQFGHMLHFVGPCIFDISMDNKRLKTIRIIEMIEYVLIYNNVAQIGSGHSLFGPTMCISEMIGTNSAWCINICFGLGEFVLIKHCQRSGRIIIDNKMDIEDDKYYILKLLAAILAFRVNSGIRRFIKYSAIRSHQRDLIASNGGISVKSILKWAQRDKMAWVKKVYV